MATRRAVIANEIWTQQQRSNQVARAGGETWKEGSPERVSACLSKEMTTLLIILAVFAVTGLAMDIGGGFFDSKSTSKQLAQTTGDNGLIVTGKAAVVAQPGSIAVGSRGKYQEAGSFDFAGARGVTITTNTQSVDPEIVSGALATTLAGEQNLVDAIKAAQAASGETTASGNEAVAKALGKLGDLLQSQQTGGQTALLKPLVLLGLAVAAVIAFIFWTKK